jgi:hypothetical protein
MVVGSFVLAAVFSVGLGSIGERNDRDPGLKARPNRV